MALQSKMTVYAAVAGVVALMGGIVWFASLDNVQLEQVDIELQSVKLIDVNNVQNQAKFDVTFLVKNPSEKTFTVSQIGYDLYGDGIFLGAGAYSTVDIALPGRALFPPGGEVPLKSIFVLNKSEINSDIYQNAIENKFSNFAAEGMITTESSWSIVEKDFRVGFN